MSFLSKIKDKLGVGHQATPSDVPRPRLPTGNGLLLLGDDVRVEIEHWIREAQPTLDVRAAAMDATPEWIADAALAAKHAVMVIDVRNGVNPILREHVLIARQAYMPWISILLLETEQRQGDIAYGETPEEQIQLMKDLLDMYNMNGAHTPAFFLPIGVDGSIDMSDVMQLVSDHEGMKDRDTINADMMKLDPAVPTSRFRSEMYWLDSMQWRHRDDVDGLDTRPGRTMDLWVMGKSVRATLLDAETTTGGENGWADWQLDREFDISAGENMFIKMQGQVIAIGLVSEISG